MPTESREIRVFLSSTFRDMDAERSHLVKTVFPRIRAACHERRVGFTEIDLRWGVTEEESRNGATVEICLKEIERCRDFPPFFIGFLGERYGWVPREDELAAYWDRYPDSPFAEVIRGAVRRGISVTELEMELAVLGTPETLAALAMDTAADRVLLLLRDPDLTAALHASARSLGATEADFWDGGNGKLDALKTRIRSSQLSHVDGYDSIAAFGAVVERHLRSALDRYFPASEVPSAEQRVDAAHAHFRFHRLRNFLPRSDIRGALLDAIRARDASPALGPVVLSGPSGLGKSALMADLARHLTEQPVLGDVYLEVMDHYVGADARLSLAAWVDRVLRRVHPEIADLTGPVPEGGMAQADVLGSWLAYAARRREHALAEQGWRVARVRYLLLIDAMDQLADGGADVSLLNKVGSDGLVILSVADGTPAHRATEHWQRIEVAPLDAPMRLQLIRETLTRFRKVLPEPDTVRLASAPQSGSPLFLGLALEELRVDAQHETLSTAVTAILDAPDAETLLLHAFLLDPDYSRPEQPDLAVRFMALLGAARQGLTEEQLSALLALPGDPVAEDIGRPRLPRAQLSHLLNSFGPFLLSKGDCRAPMHRSFGASALAYVGEAAVREFLVDQCASEGDAPDAGAVEALFQLTALAQMPGARRPEFQRRLRERLHSWGHWHALEPQVVADALAALHPEEADLLTAGWVAAIRSLRDEAIVAEGARWLALGRYLKRVVFRQYHPALAVLEALHDRVQSASAGVDWTEDVALALADAYGPFARYREAGQLERVVLEARRDRLGGEHPGTLRAMANLALTLHVQGDYAGARALRVTVLDAHRRLSGREDRKTILAMAHLAVTLHALGDYAGARTLEETVLEARRRLFGPEHPSTLTAMARLATTLCALGDYAGARSILETVLHVRQRLSGSEHLTTVSDMEDLAVILRAQGDYVAARRLQDTVLQVYRRILGPEHPGTLTALNNLAVIMGEQGDYGGARRLKETVLGIERRILGPEHPRTLKTTTNLAASLVELGDLAGARALQETAVEAYRRHLGSAHPDTITAMDVLAMTLQAQGDLGGARAMMAEVVEARRRHLGPEHPDTLMAFLHLAGIIYAVGDYAAARSVEEAVLEARRRLLGREHPDTLAAMHNLAATLRAQGDYGAARALHEDMLEAQRRLFGPEHPNTLTAMYLLAKTLHGLGDLVAARQMAETVREARQRVLGATHPDTERVVRWIAESYPSPA